MIRQFFSYNLKERMASMPYLTEIEKKWISYQILYGLTQIHNKGKCHGDLKLENVLMSSIGSVFLCDIAPFKPAYIQQDDVGSFTYYFGSNSSVKSCYLAPERLVDKNTLNEFSNSFYNVTPSMDVFSAGAVIAELFLEDILFDHSKLLSYKNGKFDLEKELRKINNKNLENLLIKMLAKNPLERIDLEDCLKIFEEEICPISFSKLLIHFNTLIVSSDYWKPDKRIGLIYKYWKLIWKVIYGQEDDNEAQVPELYQNLNNLILNQIIPKDSFTKHYIETYFENDNYFENYSNNSNNNKNENTNFKFSHDYLSSLT